MSSQPVAVTPKHDTRTKGIGLFIMALLIIVFGLFLIYPIIIIFIQSFNLTLALRGTFTFGFGNWSEAFSQPGIMSSLLNTFIVYFGYTVFSFPIAVLISWILARTPIPFSRGLEFMFWISYMMPALTTTIGWALLLDPFFGFINVTWMKLPFANDPLFDIYSVEGIIFAHLMANAISQKVMLLTPAFRNMNVALEEAGRVSGAGRLKTMIRVTLPVMVPVMIVVLMLNTVRMFNSFEIEQILGTPINFYVYSTRIFDLVRSTYPPEYGQATALASLTMVIIAIFIPLQRWLMSRRQYTTLSSGYSSGLVHLGWFQPVAGLFVVIIAALLTIVPILTLLGGSFMTRAGFFAANPPFTLEHWITVLNDPAFFMALRTTFLVSMTTAIISPILFSMVAYVLVRTRLPGRTTLDIIIWGSAGIPGILSGLGLLWVITGTPGLTWLFGTVWILMIVVIFQGNTTGVQMFKTNILQVGKDMEEAARTSGAGWLKTYWMIWIPLLAPSMVLIGTINFVIAAGSTSSLILLASRETMTLAILALEYMTTDASASREVAGIISLVVIVMTAGLAIFARWLGYRIGVKDGSN